VTSKGVHGGFEKDSSELIQMSTEHTRHRYIDFIAPHVRDSAAVTHVFLALGVG